MKYCVLKRILAANSPATIKSHPPLTVNTPRDE